MSISNAYADLSISASGYDGTNGSDGSYYGDAGGSGSSGYDSGSINLTVTLDDEFNMTLVGTSDSDGVNKTLNSKGQNIRFYAVGGDGGDGGDGVRGQAGSDGYRGQQGFSGRVGSQGRDGAHGTRFSPNGGSGGDGTRGYAGGHGSRGGDGGNGSRGGDAGFGGNAGDGGAVVIKYTNPAVLMHFYSRVGSGSRGTAGNAGVGGRRGSGGSGGAGGIGGRGGRGGRGGSGYRCSTAESEDGCTNGSRGRDGRRGNSGRNGNSGRSGFDGMQGMSGNSATDGHFATRGTISYQHLDANGRVISTHSSNDFYHLNIEDFKLVDENEDSIFEPGEKVFIKNIKIKNIGVMAMPAGGQIVIEGKEMPFKLPAIGVGKSIVINPSWSYTLSEESEIGKTKRISLETAFRGLIFNNGDLSKVVTLKRPVVITDIKVARFFKFNQKQSLILTVTNISTKNYSNIGLNYTMEGKLPFNITKKLGTIVAGKSSKEIVSYIASDDLLPYETSILKTSLLRGDKLYSTKDFSLQVVPSYVEDKKSKLLLLVNGMQEATYQIITNRLKALKVQHSVYDTRINEKIQNTVMDLYKNKQIFFANYGGNIDYELESLTRHLQVSGGVSGFNLGRVLERDHYFLRIHQSEDNFHSLSNEEKRIRFVKAILDSTKFEDKLQFIKEKFNSNDTEFIIQMREALATELEDEFYIAKEYKSIYKNEGNLVWKLNKYVKDINSANDFDLKAFYFEIVPSLWEFKYLDGRYKTFKRNWGELSSLYSEYQELEQSCKTLKGTYISTQGVTIRFENEYRKKTKGIMSSGEFTFKGKRKLRSDSWTLKYKNEDGEKLYAKIQTSCEGPKVTLNILLDDERELSFMKYLTY